MVFEEIFSRVNELKYFAIILLFSTLKLPTISGECHNISHWFLIINYLNIQQKTVIFKDLYNNTHIEYCFALHALSKVE